MVEFNAETHKYYNDGVELISVTTLIKKHGLSPDYGGVAPDVLKKASERGTLVHKEIEEYIKTGVKGFTPELESFIAEIETRKLKVIASEMTVNNDLVAGTLDLLVCDEDDKIGLIDFKTTSEVHRESVMWQENIYADLAPYMVDWLECWHFFKDGGMEAIIVPKIDVTEIDRLYACERNGEIYHYALTGLDKELIVLADYEEELEAFEKKKKEIDAKAKAIREAILKAMVENNIPHYETDRLKFTVKKGATRTTLLTDALFADNPNINRADYEVKTTGKPSLLITIKAKPVEIENKD